jgi:hypothetical protein
MKDPTHLLALSPITSHIIFFQGIRGFNRFGGLALKDVVSGSVDDFHVGRSGPVLGGETVVYLLGFVGVGIRRDNLHISSLLSSL